MKNVHDTTYAREIRYILTKGIEKSDRTGVGTKSVFGRMMRFAMGHGFPLLTLKKTPFRYLAEEMFWFIGGGRKSEGGMNNNDLLEKGIDIWSPWAGEDGSLGPIYGYQWRNWPATKTSARSKTKVIDQLREAEEKLKTNPDDRRIIVSAWNVAQIKEMALPPCHLLFQFYSHPIEDTEVRALDLQLYQRSCDMFIGVPFNIAQYALLLHLMAKATNHMPGTLIWVGGDCHLYTNQFEAAEKMLERHPRIPPNLNILTPREHIDDFRYDDLKLVGYDPHDPIRVEIAV